MPPACSSGTLEQQLQHLAAEFAHDAGVLGEVEAQIIQFVGREPLGRFHFLGGGRLVLANQVGEVVQRRLVGTGLASRFLFESFNPTSARPRRIE